MTKAQVLNLTNTLSMKPRRICRSQRLCAFCPKSITSGDEYRDCGPTRSAHELCYKKAVALFKPKVAV